MIHKINIRRGGEGTGERDLLCVLPRGVLGSYVYGRYHDVCSGCSSTLRLIDQVLGAHPLHGPWLALRHGEAVQAEGGRDDRDLDALPGGEDRRPLRF